MAQIPKVFKLLRHLNWKCSPTNYSLSHSDVEPMKMAELLDMADDECREMWDNLTLNYSYDIGNSLLRQEIANMYPTISDEHVLVTTSMEGVFIAISALVPYLKNRYNQDALHVITTWPAFQCLTEHVQNTKCDLSSWKARCGDNGWYFDMEELKDMIKDNTRLLVVNFPHNPTGFMPSVEEYEELIDLCKSRGIFLFSDEVYWFSKHDETPDIPSACDEMEDAITLGGLSKIFALPGLRIGWLCTRNEEVYRLMHNLKDFLTMCSPVPCETLAIIAIRNRQAIFKRSRNIFYRNLPLLDKFFAKHKDVFTWHRPKVGTIAWVELKGSLLNLGKGGASGFAEVAMEEGKVNLISSDLFHAEDRFIRIGFGKRDLPEALEQFSEFVDTYK
eukprot:GHVU01059584.1.p1 GENE.GHVU01059584.1~~GHVU01059584.1.p1  ORF type:complete len:389 (-),score=44.34 GHVU01059584.1:828-1994(-)